MLDYWMLSRQKDSWFTVDHGTAVCQLVAQCLGQCRNFSQCSLNDHRNDVRKNMFSLKQVARVFSLFLTIALFPFCRCRN